MAISSSKRSFRGQAPSGAQGTVEYLVIIAVVVVIGLVVVGLLSGQAATSSKVSVTSSEIKDKVGVGGIRVVDAVAGSDKNGVFVLMNAGSEPVTVSKITVDSVDHNFSASVAGNSQMSFKVQDIAACDGSNKSYGMKVYYTSSNSLPNTADFQTVTIDCVASIPSGNFVIESGNGGGNGGVTPNVAPTVSLTSPADNNSTTQTRISFIFVPRDTDGNVTDCNLNISSIGLDVNRVHNPTTDANNTLQYTLVAGNSYDWNVSCTDNNNSTTTSLTNHLTITSPPIQLSSCWSDIISPHPLCDCNDVNKVRDYVNWNYAVQNDINMNASGCAAYQSGSGFTPIPGFAGTFDGNNKIISNLKINLPAGTNIGLFGDLEGTVSNIGLTNVNVTGYYDVGGLVGYSTGTISNSYSTGAVLATNYAAGGLVGYQNGGSTDKSYSTVSVSGNNYYTGGLVGRLYNGTISNSYSTGSVAGYDDAGGLVSYSDFGTISNCYSTGRVTGAMYLGGLIGNKYTATISGSYWDLNTSGQLTSSGGTGKTTAQMKQQATFSGWSFPSFWGICEGTTYPWLSWENRSC